MLLHDPPAPPTSAPPSAVLPATRRTFHVVPAAIVAGVSLVVYTAFVGEWLLSARRPGGGSVSGFVAGVVAGGLFIYLLLYAFRKRRPVSRLFRSRPIKYYLAWHVWLGLLTLPLVLVHASGPLFHALDVVGLLPSCCGPTRPGGFVALAFLLVYLGVFASGGYGLWLQHSLPTRLLREIPGETIRAQIPALVDELRVEAALLVRAACGPPPQSLGVLDVLSDGDREAIRRARHKQGAGLLRPFAGAQVVNNEKQAETLWQFYRSHVEPHFRQPAAPSRLALPAEADAEFDHLRGQLSSALHPVVEALREASARRRQFDEQAHWHDRLHAWIPLHLVLSAALAVLLFAHGVSAITFW